MTFRQKTDITDASKILLYNPLIFRIMEKKILLFNYFVKKAIEKEKELLGLQDDRVALLALIFSRYSVQHCNASGWSPETAYAVEPKFLQELFILLCSNAEKSGDNLKYAFDFVGIPRYEWGDELKDMHDRDITYQLNNNIFPYAKMDDVREIYVALLPNKTPEEQDNILTRMAAVFSKAPRPEALEQPEPCAETAMIDRAWERLLQHDGFISMLKPSGKQDHCGRSIPYQRYVEHLSTLLNREY